MIIGNIDQQSCELKQKKNIKHKSILNVIQKQTCMVLNKELFYIYLGCIGVIRQFGFNSMYKLIQKLPSPNVELLFYLNLTKQLISYNKQTIQIWDKTQKRVIQVISSLGSIYQSMALSQKDGLIVTGSQNGLISFWSKNKNENVWICDQKLKYLESFEQLSFNPESSILICGNSSKIQIIQCQEGIWTEIQVIQMKYSDFKAIFVSDNIFVVFNNFSEFVESYCQQKNEQFHKVHQISLSNNIKRSIFPFYLMPNICDLSQINQKQYVLLKHNMNILLISYDSTGKLEMQYPIKYNIPNFSPKLIKEGKFLLCKEPYQIKVKSLHWN